MAIKYGWHLPVWPIRPTLPAKHLTITQFAERSRSNDAASLDKIIAFIQRGSCDFVLWPHRCRPAILISGLRIRKGNTI